MFRKLRRLINKLTANEVSLRADTKCEFRDSVVSQKQLLLSYRCLPEDKILDFREVGFSTYSQNDEDGILLYIFARLGVRNFNAVEMCAGNGYESNTANLIINHGWSALLLEGDECNVAEARIFYSKRRETTAWPPQIVHAWITRENVNSLLSDAGYKGEIDLLSLDVDGNDYWLWEALEVVDPRVVVLEYNHLHGPKASVSIPYQDDFRAEFTEYGSDYAGASLAAFIKLGKRKGYRYIGSNAIGTNAFFVRDSLGVGLFPEAFVDRAFEHPRAVFGTNVRYAGIQDRKWEEV